ncbi:hypothetical protein ACTJJ7_12335 [Phyllobacterium sp. 22229]|uniref:hypothetical protein n=1 Tax=Hyphomicrobiales TaxID=356 RepID=UPI003EC00541
MPRPVIDNRDGQTIEKPPSTGKDTPVTNEAAADNSHSAASTTSVGLPRQPTGCIASVQPAKSGLLPKVEGGRFCDTNHGML